MTISLSGTDNNNDNVWDDVVTGKCDAVVLVELAAAELPASMVGVLLVPTTVPSVANVVTMVSIAAVVPVALVVP